MRGLGEPTQATCPKCSFTRETKSSKGQSQCSKCGHYFVFSHERYREYKRRWQKANPEKYRERIVRHQRKLSKLYSELREARGNICDLCGNHYKRMEFHEINHQAHPLNSVWIRNHPEDFVLLCKSCHEAAHWASFRLGWNYETFKLIMTPHFAARIL